MSKKYASSPTRQPLSTMTTSSTMMKLVDVNGKERHQSKGHQRIDTSPHLYLNVDEPSQSSTRFNTPIIQSTISSIQNASYFAAPIDTPSPSIHEPTKVWPSPKDTSISESASSAPKRNHKHKHHHHHHHHRGKRHCYHHHHHHNRQRQAKNIGQQATDLSPSKAIITNSKTINQKQQPIIVYREVSNKKDYTFDSNALGHVVHETDNKTASAEDQQAPLIIYRDANTQQPLVADHRSQPMLVNQDQEAKASKKTTPLQAIENKFVSQRAASLNETQVGNYCPMTCTQSSPSIISSCGSQQVETVYYDDSCCAPSSSYDCPSYDCPSNSCILQQCNPCACCVQQPQQQIYYCTEPTASQDYICSPSNNNIFQQISCPQQQQQQYICVDNTPSTALQSTIINQIPIFNPMSTNTTSQSYICVPQTSSPQNASIVIQQQPQIQAQPLQIIQSPQAQQGQYLRISSATPQIIQTIPSPGMQSMQPQMMQTIQASPQILYQRPYDPIVLPVQNQQFVVANTAFTGLSRPSYAPARQMPAGPHMFQHALARTVASRTGLPISLPAASGLQLVQSPMLGAPGGAQLASAASALVNYSFQSPSSLPIVPLTAGALLIPFQSSESSADMTHGVFPQASRYPSSLKNFDDIRQQIQRRAQFLADFERQNPIRLPPSRANTTAPSRPTFPSGLSQPLFLSLPNASQPSVNQFSLSVPQSSSALPLNVPPALIRSQTPYTRGNIAGASSSSSSRSSVSSTSPASAIRPSASTGLTYSQPSFAGSRRGSVSSGLFTPYQSLRP